MIYCSRCGKQNPDSASFCESCGAPIKVAIKPQNNNPNDSKSFGFAFLGFLFPLIGLILYIVWRKDMPLRASSVGKGALIAVIIEIIVGILILVISAVGLFAINSDLAILLLG